MTASTFLVDGGLSGAYLTPGVAPGGAEEAPAELAARAGSSRRSRRGLAAAAPPGRARSAPRPGRCGSRRSRPRRRRVLTSAWNWMPQAGRRGGKPAGRPALRASAIAPGGSGELVAVPLEGRRSAGRAAPSSGSSAPSAVTLHLVPADLRLGAPGAAPRPPPRRAAAHPRQTPSSGMPPLEQLGQQRPSRRAATGGLLLVGVHGAAEGEHGVVVARVGRAAAPSAISPASSSHAAAAQASANTPGPASR